MKRSVYDSTGQIQNLIQEGLFKLGTAKVQNAIMVIGRTGHGKSTLINCLAGAKLKAVRKGFPGELIIEAEENVGDIKIVSGGASGTTVPGKYFDPQRGLTYFDCPGFDDTRGVEQEIANAYYIKHIFELAQRVKVIVVCKASEFQDRLNTFTELIKKVTQLFPNITDAAKSMFLVISKVSPVSRLEDFKDFLISELEPQGGLSGLNNQERELVKNIIYNKGNILLFYAPGQTGPRPLVSKETIDVINALQYTQNPKANIVLSAQAHEVVYEWREEVSQNIVAQLKEISNLINKYYINSLDAKVDIKSLNDKTVATKNYLNVIMQNSSQPSVVSKMTQKILLLHNINPKNKMAAIDLQLTYINFIQHLQPHHKNDNISKGFYHILDEVSTIGTKFVSIMGDDLKKQIELTAEQNQELQKQIKALSSRAPVVNNTYTTKYHVCSIFHNKIKYDNDFLNLTSKQQQKILDETGLSPSQMLNTVEIIKQENPGFDIHQMFDIDSAGQDTNLV